MPTITERLALLESQVREASEKKVKAEARRESVESECHRLEQMLSEEFKVSSVEEARQLCDRMRVDVQAALMEVEELLR